MNAGSIVILLIVLAALFFVVKKIIKNRGKSCSCCSDSCPMKNKCSKKEK
ncbi:MAG: FeoB-associated Cys-rich membrane protein [Candidatus Ornithospirochaeta sp.]